MLNSYSSQNNKRVLYYDILNILAIIAVIALHCNGIVHQYSYDNQKPWSTSLIVECVFYWAVPIFMMLSGATLMNYRNRYTTKDFFKKRVFKVLIPFLFWAIFIGIWAFLNGNLVIDDFSFKEILNIFFSNREESTYYFMFEIIGIYLTMPILSLLADPKYRNICKYTVFAIFITQSLLPCILGIFGISYYSGLSVQFGPYIIFVLLGYLISTHDFKKKERIIIYILGIASVFFRYIYTYYTTIEMQQMNYSLFSYVQFHSVLLASAVFVFFKYNKFINSIKSDKIIKIINNVAASSFGVYLIHKIIIYHELKIFNINNFTWQWRIFGIVTTYLICLLIIMLLKKIPIVKKLVP